MSALARGARRSVTRFGSALDLFAQGSAELHVKEGRDLHTLGAIDIVRARPELAEELGRFAAANAVAELVLRFGTGDAGAGLYDTLNAALDQIATASPENASEAGLAGAWSIVAELGFAPALTSCASCHRPLEDESDLAFQHDAGGTLCPFCAKLRPGGRTLPASARARLRTWTSAQRMGVLDPREARAHQRLLREFLLYHLSDSRPLRAFDVWEQGAWEHLP